MCELVLEPKRFQIDPTTGRFHKGHVPHNKGKKWDDYMDKDKAERLRKFIREKLPHKGNPNLPGWNAIPIFALDKNDNIVGWFKSISEASKKMKIDQRHIRAALDGKRLYAGGMQWVKDERRNGKV